MKRESRRLLSGLLALSLCLGLVSPAALAAEPEENIEPYAAAPISVRFTTSSAWEPASTPTERVWLDVADNDTVVDSFTYTVASDQDASSDEGEEAADRYAVDEYGYVTLKSGKAAIPGETLTVTASVKYFDGDDVIWADNVLNGTSIYTSGAAGTFCGVSNISEVDQQVARTGQYGITTATGAGNNKKAPFYKLPSEISAPVTLTAWYYDPCTDEELAYTKPDTTPGYDSAEGQLGIFLNPSAVADAAIDFMGIAYISDKTGTSAYDKINYCLRGGTAGKTYVTGAVRSEGWHKMVWEVASDKITLTMSKLNANGTLTPEGSTTATNTTKITSIGIANNKGNCDYSAMHMENKHFLDDISVVKTAAMANPKSQTLTTTITVAGETPEPPTPSTAPVDAVLVGGKTLTPGGVSTDKIRLDTANAAGYVIDEITGYTYDNTKITIDENGAVKIKDGYTPAAEETVKVTVDYKYYGGNDVKYVESFDDDKATPFVNATGINYAINNGQSRTGRYGVTAKAVTKNGLPATAAVGPFEDVRVTAWYYDPYDDAEKNSTATDVERFGFAATPAGTPNTNQIGVCSIDSANKKMGFYGYRAATTGNFALSNAARSTGWHRLEWLVTAEGTKLFVDKNEIIAGTEDAALLKARTKVENLTLVTNWCQQSDQSGMKLIYNRHYIDDISVVAAAATPTATSTTVQVKIAPDSVATPVITSQPTAQSATAGGSATFTLTATGAESYLWQVCDKDGNNGANISGNGTATTASLTLTGLTAGETYYYCNVTNTAGTIKSDVVKLTVLPKGLYLTASNPDGIRKGEQQRVYIEGMGGIGIESFKYTITGNPDVLEKVNFDENTGVVTIKDGIAPAQGDTVTVGASVTYYPEDQLLWAEDLETPNSLIPSGSKYGISHSGKSDLTGLGAARTGKLAGTTQTTFENGMFSPNINSTGKLVYWYYDPYTEEEQTRTYSDQVKFGMMVNGYSDLFLGVAVPASTEVGKDETAGAIEKQEYRTTYTYRENGKWLRTNIERTPGWHKMEINVAADGATLFIDGDPVCLYGSEAPIKNTIVKSITKAIFATNWGNKTDQVICINNKHFIDDVYIIKPGITPSATKETLQSVTLPLLDIQYDHTPKNPTVDSTYPKDQTFTVTPSLDELDSIKVDDKPLTSAQWEKVFVTGPSNATYFPADMKGLKLIVKADAFKGLSDGSHKLVLSMTSGSTYEIPFTAKVNTHAPTSYYLSNSGNDGKLGTSPAEAWATFKQLSTVTFGPGDKIYLEANSVWNDVQFQPKGSGAPGAPVVMTKYNDGGDPSKRPILNGNGTTANKDTAKGEHSYLTFDSWRRFYPSGTIELFNVEQWEVRGIEITNYKSTYTAKSAASTVGGKPSVSVTDDTGRNGIAVIYDFMEVLGETKLPGTAGTAPNWSGDAERNQKMEEFFYKAGKLEHIVIEDCYIHDVTGRHPNNGGQGAGGKMSGGINVYGPFDDLKLNNNIIMYCDVEGIRNDVLAWRGDTDTQFPHYMEGIEVNNNFMVGIPGDGVVISSAIEPTIRNNYLTDAGYSYFADGTSGGLTAKPMGNRDNPVIYRDANFAGLWFIGTLDAVAEYNESVNNVWTCNDGEAFDADMFCRGTVFQYNYTYRNNGGMALFMGTMYDGTVVRYNVSVEDGEGIGSGADQDAVFHYAKAPEAIYNNLFVLGPKVESIFGGGSNSTRFFNNIVVAPNGLLQPQGGLLGFHINGSSDGDNSPKEQNNPKLSGEMTNNIFYPAAILDSVVDGSSVTLENNKTLTENEFKTLFYDFDGFMKAQPVKALIGRSDLTGTPVQMISGKGAGVAMSQEAGRGVKTPTGGFDYTQFEGIKTVEGSPAIGGGTAVTYPYQSKDTSGLHTLTKDFFKNSLNGVTTPDIGPYQWSADASHYVKLTYEGNGATVAAETVKSGTTHTLPTPTKTNFVFDGWHTDAALENKVAASYAVPAAGVKLYAKWTERAANTYDVTFDAQGGSAVDAIIGVAKDAKITAPTPPTKAHYVFDGWYKESSCTNEWDFTADTVTTDTTLYAKWAGEVYTVTFDKNGGDTEAAPASKTVTYPATNVDALPTAPTKTGFTFLGWTTAQNGNTFFGTGTAVTESITVYAKWVENAENTYNVVFDTQGGSAVAPITGVTKGDEIAAPAAPTKAHYVFKGWYKESACTNAWDFEVDTVTAETTLYAKWEGETFTVTFDKNGGDTDATPVSKAVVYPATTVDALPTAPAKTGFTFTGWTTAPNGNTVFNADTTVTGDITVYAKWESNDSIDIATAKALVEGATYTVAQSNAVTEATARARLVAMVEALALNGVSARVEKVSYTAAISGTESNPTGTNGSYVFTVALSKGVGTPATTGSLTMTITATPYTAPAPSGGGSSYQPVVKEDKVEGGKVSTATNRDGSTTYSFKPEKGMELKYIRVNGLTVSVADKLTLPKGSTDTVVAVFTPTGEDPLERFTDVEGLGDEAQQAVSYVVGAGLFGGTDADTFAPEMGMNRAMFATVLARLYGADTKTHTDSGFSDVSPDMWYGTSVIWAAQKGYVQGVGGDSFAPEQNLTRQELVTLIYRFAKDVGVDVSPWGDLSGYRDVSELSGWSAEAMSWAVSAGLLTGRAGGLLAPNAEISRVEAAIILERMANLLTKKA